MTSLEMGNHPAGIMTEKSTERASIRGGVPVLNVPLVILIHVNAEQVQ